MAALNMKMERKNLGLAIKFLENSIYSLLFSSFSREESFNRNVSARRVDSGVSHRMKITDKQNLP